MDHQGLKELPPERLAASLEQRLGERLAWREDFAPDGARREWFLSLLALLRDGAETLEELAASVVPFVFDGISYEAEAVREHLTPPQAVLPRMEALRASLEAVDPWTAEDTRRALQRTAESLELSPSELALPLQVALFGSQLAADLGEVLCLQGRGWVLQRLDTLLSFLGGGPCTPQETPAPPTQPR
jgi:glutamyl/glutaminyl-tRNA synthetase